MAERHPIQTPETLETHELAWLPPALSLRNRLRLPTYDVAVWAVVLIGIVLRIAQYLYNRSLWMDESFLALNVIDKPFGALFGQLSFNQAAPPGFLLVERVDVALFGKSEYALRLFPLLCGISSIFLFKRVTNVLLGRGAALIALALFSLSDGLIYYASEAKQYSTDVAITLLIAVAGLDLSSRRPSRRRAIVWGLIGSAAVWFSHAAAFAVGAVLVALLAGDIARRRWDIVKPMAAVLGIWLASLGVALAYERSTASHLLNGFGGPKASSTVFPTGTTFFRNAPGGLADALGIPTTGPLHDARYVFWAIGFVGAAALARRTVRVFAFVAAPAAGVFVAAALGAYPVLTRTIVFLLPLVVVLVSEGVVALVGALRRWRTVATLGLVAAFLAIPAATAGRHLVAPRQRQEMKPILRYLVSQWQPGDSLLVFYQAQYALRYYIDCDCLLSSRIRRKVFAPLVFPDRLGLELYAPALLSGRRHILIAQRQDSLRDYLEKMTPLLRRKRVWVLVTATDSVQTSLLRYLSCTGQRDEYTRRNGADYATVALYRYDLSSWRSLSDGACGARFGL